MKVLVCGSRSIKDSVFVQKYLDTSPFEITELISGGAEGVDQLAEEWARARDIKITQFLPNYKMYGSYAPIARDNQMAKYADAVIALWDGESRGTEHTVKFAADFRKPIHLVINQGGVIEERDVPGGT